MSTPRYTHDCDACRFAGRLDTGDVWVCPSQGVLTGERFGSLILRFSDQGAGYISIPDLGERIPQGFRPALDLAVGAGIIVDAQRAGGVQ